MADARAIAERGETLPPPEQIGLVLPAPLARNARPQRVESAALRTDVPWIEPTATHRIGITIDAGNVDRFQLPIELDVDLPAAARIQTGAGFSNRCATTSAGKSWRRSTRSPEHGRRAAGLGAAGSVGEERTGVRSCVHGAASSTSASSRSRTGGRRVRKDSSRFDNNAVGCSWEAEGAHVFGWEVTACAGRDVTMPGTRAGRDSRILAVRFATRPTR